MLKRALAVFGGIAAVFLSGQSAAPNLDFEEGLRGWTPSGSAFDGQPTEAASLETTNASAPIRVGGDYWRGLRYPIGGMGAHLVHTTDPGRGTLVSDEIELTANQRYWSVLVGGANDTTHLRIELQLRDDGAASTTYPHDGDFLVVKAFTGSGAERLREEVFEIPSELGGRRARVRIVDDSAGPGGHINVDDVRFSGEKPVRPRAPLWGVGDYHTHPMNYMAFGALRGIRTVWGTIGGNYADYLADPHLVSRDLPACTKSHGGGPSAEVFINGVEGRFVPRKNLIDLFRLIGAQHHSHLGGPTFDDFPSFTSGLHEQMHVTQIHRAWEGGLRLMVAIAVHNVGVEYLFSKPQDGIVDPSTERQVLDAQICGMKALADMNRDWMEIAFSPADARRIIEGNKLAIVLGVEMDELGRLDRDDSCTTLKPCPFKTFDEEIDYLWTLGIRQVTPIHAVDNRLGSAAVFQPVYNSLNDLLNRGQFNVKSGDLHNLPLRFFQIREGGCLKGPYAGKPGECVAFRLDTVQQRPALMHSKETLWRTAPFLKDTNAPPDSAYDGMMNLQGLTDEGRGYITRLMRRGMIVGLEHMSQRSVDDVYGIVAGILRGRGHPECAGIGTEDVPSVCYDGAYPLVASHASLRALSVYNRDSTTVEGYRPSEYEFSNSEAGLLGRTGGFLGQFTAESPVVLTTQFAGTSAVQNDCAGSSKSFALSYMYGLEFLRGAVGLATDFTIISGTSPRFGTHACWASHAARNPRKERARMPSQYKVADQRDGVRYDYYATNPVPDGVKPGNNSPLTSYTMDGRRGPFDFNVDGFAHYGMLPDFLQDLKNVGMPRDAFESLFSSAEAYVRTWEKVGAVMRVTYDGFTPSWPSCAVVCRGLCPDSPNAGAPARP